MDQKNFNPQLVLGGPWEGLGTETPLPLEEWHVHLDL
jgi:hypothetical protein